MEFSIGNTKLGKDTVILNMTSATDCPSKKLGLCKLTHKCYAMKAERQYPSCLPFRRRQETQWTNESVETIIDSIKKKNKNKNIKYVRISEAGDFRTQEDVQKLFKLSEALEKENIKVYAYTARQDLNFEDSPANLTINGTFFKIHNQFIPVPLLPDPQTLQSHEVICEGECPNCNYCKENGDKKIYIKIH